LFPHLLSGLCDRLRGKGSSEPLRSSAKAFCAP